jgi:hypothetical protein
MGYDAAASLAAAFSKLPADGGTPTGEAAPIPSAEGGAAVSGPLPKGAAIPTAADLAKVRGGQPKVDVAPDHEELPKEADSLKKWAVNMKKDWKAEKAKREALEKEVETLRGTDPEEVSKLKQQNAEYERELQISRVEATREFKDAVVTPLRTIRDSVGSLAAKYELDGAEIFSVFSEEDPSGRSDKLSDITAGMNDRDRFAIYELEKQFTRVEGTREKVTQNAKLALEKIAEHRQEQEKAQAEERATAYSSALDGVWEKAQENIPLLRPVEGDDAWNNQLTELRASARSLDMDSLDPVARAQVATRFAVTPVIYGQLIHVYGKLQEAEKALEKYQKATPNAGGGSPATAAPSEGFGDFMEAMQATLKG